MLILVVGMHRSGTSLVARGLHAMGVNLGERVDTEPDPSNPHGHWEHADVWRAQERLLIRFGREWHSSPGPLPPRWMEWPDTLETIDRFAAIAREELPRHGHWLVKDPRSSLLIPLWKAVAERLGSRLRILRIFRDAGQVAASLAARNRMPREFAVRIWADHQRSIERDAAGLDSRMLRHDAILRDPRAAFAEMGDFCGLPDAAHRAAAAAELVDPALWHHRPAANGVDHVIVPPEADIEPPDLGRVLVVMRTRWRIHMLPRAIRSVLSQTYPHWFLQIVNDGGPPHLVESEITAYRHLLQGRLGLLHRDRQYGMEAASNAGIAVGPGEFIAIHDDDDTWSPDFLARLVPRLHAGGHAVVSRSRLVRERWDGSDHVPQEVVECGPSVDLLTATDLAQRNHFPPISFLFRRRVYEEVGPFNEGLPALGDWHFNRRVAARWPIDVHPETLASWRLRDPSATTPNSPRIDHWRSDQYVRFWPEEPMLPEFFGQARQVRVWGEGAGLEGFPRMSPSGQGKAATASDGSLLPAGLYLFRFPFEGSAAGASIEQGTFRAVLAGGPADRETVPLVARAEEFAAVLLNARRPIVALGLQVGDGEIEPLPTATEVVRLGDAIGRLDDFAGPPRLPDVLCIGAQRSGTTWLHTALQSHPRVWACEIKEFHQFDWDGCDPIVGGFRQRQALAALRERAEVGTDGSDGEHEIRRLLRHAFPPAHSWENYAAMFAAAPADRVACDFTPAYATLGENHVADIMRVMPHLKVIFILRDPVTRSVSGAVHELGQAGVARPTEVELRRACDTPSNVLRTDYLRTLELWRRHLPESRLLVLFHDDIARDPAGVIARTCGFLGIGPPRSRPHEDSGVDAPRNAGRATVAWPELARVKAELSARWLPMLLELERQFGEPVCQWRLAAEVRLRAAEAARGDAGAGGDNTIVDNLAQWDMRDPWPKDGDEWDGQARACGIAYDDWKARITARYQPLLARGGTIVEIGPGHGRWSHWLVEQAGLLVLCDISPNCLDACRARLAGRGRIRTHVSQGADLPADLTGKVDAVWSYDCLVHVDPRECERYLMEIARVLRPGGVAVLHHADRRREWFDRVAAAIRWFWAPHESATDFGWRSRVSRRDIRRWAQRAGLVVNRQETTWLGNVPGGQVCIGVPRFGDCITVLRRVGMGRQRD